MNIFSSYSSIRCIVLSLLLVIFSSTMAIAEDLLVFEASYDVYWKGWSCGAMHAQLWKRDDHSYCYTQDLRSTLFFYSFSQKEESVFYIKGGKIVSHEYRIDKDGVDGPSYIAMFEGNHVDILLPGVDDILHYPIATNDVYDKLVTQLVLIRNIQTNNSFGDRTVCFADPSGLHYRTYSLEKSSQGICFKSNYGNKSSSFILDPNRRYIPVSFEQYRHGELTLTGKVVETSFGKGWDDFLANNN